MQNPQLNSLMNRPINTLDEIDCYSCVNKTKKKQNILVFAAVDLCAISFSKYMEVKDINCFMNLMNNFCLSAQE